MQQIRPSVVAEHPHLKPKELFTVIQDRWKLLDKKDKEDLSLGYRIDLRKYAVEVKSFNESLTIDDKRRIQKRMIEISEIATRKQFTRQIIKPKKPPCSFLKFIHAQNDRQPEEKYRDYLKRMTSKWNELSETAKKEYATKPEEMTKYRCVNRFTLNLSDFFSNTKFSQGSFGGV